MSRKYNIRWTESDNQELRKAVKNFNQKIARLEKKNPQIKNALPEKVSVKQMRDLIETRSDLNRELNALKRFSKRGAETIVPVPNNDYNLQITKWQKQEMNRRVGTINRKRKEKLKELQDVEQTSRGKPLGYTKGQIGMGRQEQVALSPMKSFTQKMNVKDLKYKYQSILKESQSTYWDRRDLILKENYVKSLEDNYGKNAAFLVDKIKEMDMKEFKKIFYAEGGHSFFEFSYPKNKEEIDKDLNYLSQAWKIKRS